MSIYICTICHQQKDGDFHCGFIKGREDEEICEECSKESEVKLPDYLFRSWVQYAPKEEEND